MKLTEIKDEAALDLIADLIDPVSEIASDKRIIELIKKGDRKAVIKALIKNHKKSIIEILAACEGVPVEEYHINVLSLPIKLVQLFNDPDLIDFFVSAGLMEDPLHSTDTSENIEAQEE